MSKELDPPGNIILLRGACLWILAALTLAWCMVGIFADVPLFKWLFPGKYTRVLQGHIDFLLMTALILGVYATKTPLPWNVRWAMVIGAFTNSSLFVMLAMFPVLDSPAPPAGFYTGLYKTYQYASLLLTSYGFGKAAVLIFQSTFDERAPDGVAPAGRHKRSPVSRLLTPARRFAFRRRLSQLLTPTAGRDPLLMWMIFTGLSIFSFMLLWFYGLAQKLLDADRTYISVLIVGLYVATSLHCLRRAIVLSREQTAADEVARAIRANRSEKLPRCAVASYVRDIRTKAANAKRTDVDSAMLQRVLAERLRGSNDFGAFAGDALMKLGLFGTIVGFIIMLAPMSGLDPENAAAVRSSMGVMSEGMAVAMYTTLTGLIGSLLIKIQYLFVETSASRIFTSAVELTEVHIGPSRRGELEVAA